MFGKKHFSEMYGLGFIIPKLLGGRYFGITKKMGGHAKENGIDSIFFFEK